MLITHRQHGSFSQQNYHPHIHFMKPTSTITREICVKNPDMKVHQVLAAMRQLGYDAYGADGVCIRARYREAKLFNNLTRRYSCLSKYGPNHGELEGCLLVDLPDPGQSYTSEFASELIKQLRTDNELPVAHAAAISGVDEATIASLEAGNIPEPVIQFMNLLWTYFTAEPCDDWCAERDKPAEKEPPTTHKDFGEALLVRESCEYNEGGVQKRIIKFLGENPGWFTAKEISSKVGYPRATTQNYLSSYISGLRKRSISPESLATKGGDPRQKEWSAPLPEINNPSFY